VSRHHHAPPARPRAQQRRQHARDATQITRQRQFSQELALVQLFAWHLTTRGQDAQRDGQVEAAAVLGQLGRRQVHGDLAVGVLERRVLDRHSHAVTRLAHRSFRQADDMRARQTAGQMHLDHHLRCGNAFLGTREGDRQAHGTTRADQDAVVPDRNGWRNTNGGLGRLGVPRAAGRTVAHDACRP